MIAAVHIDAMISVPAAFAAAVFLVWYWVRLGRADASRTPRRIRRLSIAIMLVSLPNFVRGLSYLDGDAQQVGYAYLISWSVSLLLVLVILLTACLDAIWTLRMHRRRMATEISDAAGKLIERARSEVSTPPPTDAGRGDRGS